MRGPGGTGTAEELREMTGDGSIACIVQTDFHQRRTAAALGSGGGIDDREKTFQEDLAHFVARDLAALGPAD